MPHPFDAGAVVQPLAELCADYPEAEVYPASQFRIEWGPVFHRGRLTKEDSCFLLHLSEGVTRRKDQ